MTNKDEKTTTPALDKIKGKPVEKAPDLVSFEIAGDKGTSQDFTLKINEIRNGASLLWKASKLAILERGDGILTPKLSLSPNFSLNGESKLTKDDASAAIEQANKWLTTYIEVNLKSLVLLDGEINQNITPEPDAINLSGAVKDIAAKLLDNLGIMERALVEEKLKVVNTEERKALWRFKIKIGATTIFIPYILKPEPTALRVMLWALYEKLAALPTPPTPGMVWVEMSKGTLPNFYLLSGYRPAGKKAVRVDMVERLADAVRPQGLKGASFEVTPETMGLVGLSGDDFANVMNAIGYQSRKHKKQEEGKEETAFHTFTWQGVAKPVVAKPKAQKRPTKKPKPPAKAAAPKKEFVLDPNSPFAALAVLQNTMKKNKKG